MVVGRPQRIGVFGGTFDPVHVGHLAAAAAAHEALNLDAVLLVVANQPWQKVDVRTVGDAEVRFAAVAAAVEGHEGLEASRIEIDGGGPSYTVDTLRLLKQIHGDETSIFLILGADAAAGLGSWKAPEEICGLAELVVLNRPGAAPPHLGPDWRVSHVVMPGLDISSTELRRRLTSGRTVDFLVPDAAVAVYRAHGLYPVVTDVPSG